MLVETYRIRTNDPLISSTAFELEKRLTASSSAAGFAPIYAVDNAPGTRWQAASGTMPQWLKIDLGQAQRLTTVTQRFATSSVWRYRIEGSNDGSTYTTLVDRTASGVLGTTVSESVSGTYRYVRLTVTGSTGAAVASSVEFMVYGQTNVPTNLSLNRDYTKYNASSSYNAAQTAEKAFDGNPSGWTNWQAGSGLFAGEWLEVDYGWYTPVNRVRLTEFDGRTTGFRIEAWNGFDWYTVTTGTSIPNGYITFPTVQAVKLRVYFTSGTAQPIIYEFETYYDPNLALNKAYSASSIYDSASTANKAFDEDGGTNWQAVNGSFADEWLEVDFGSTVSFNQVFLSEYGGRTSGYRIEYWNGTSWQTAYAGTTIGSALEVSFPAVTGSKARVYFTSGTWQPIVYEFKVHNRP